MKFVRGDLRKLQTGLLVGLALIVIGGIGVYFGNDAMQTARRELAEAQAARNEADNQLRRMRGEEMEIREKSVIFRQLEARGMVGEERRLEWSELLEAIRERRQLAGLRYEFGPQRPLDNTATMPTGRAKVWHVGWPRASSIRARPPPTAAAWRGAPRARTWRPRATWRTRPNRAWAIDGADVERGRAPNRSEHLREQGPERVKASRTLSEHCPRISWLPVGPDRAVSRERRGSSTRR